MSAVAIHDEPPTPSAVSLRSIGSRPLANRHAAAVITAARDISPGSVGVAWSGTRQPAV